MAVRVACRADVTSILGIEKLLFHEPLTRQQVSGIYSHPASMVFVSEEDEELVGYLLAYTDCCAGEILRVGVHPKYQGCGHGRGMVDRFSEAIGEDMSIEIKTSDRDAVAWLERCQFRVVGECGKLAGQPILLMRRGWRFARAPMLKYRMGD